MEPLESHSIQFRFDSIRFEIVTSQHQTYRLFAVFRNSVNSTLSMYFYISSNIICQPNILNISVSNICLLFSFPFVFYSFLFDFCLLFHFCSNIISVVLLTMLHDPYPRRCVPHTYKTFEYCVESNIVNVYIPKIICCSLTKLNFGFSSTNKNITVANDTQRTNTLTHDKIGTSFSKNVLSSSYRPTSSLPVVAEDDERL